MEMIEMVFKNVFESIMGKLEREHSLHLTRDLLMYWKLCWENEVNRISLQD